MSLTANPLVNWTSAHGDISSQKSFQNFNGNIVNSTTENYSNPGNYVRVSDNATFINNLFSNLGVRNPGVTAIVVSNGNQELWGTAQQVPTSGLPLGTTIFTKLFSSQNENISSGNLASP